MLLRHTLQYLLGRGGPAVFNLVAVAIYSRLLSPEQYGKFALVFAAVMLGNALFFLWLRMGLLRFSVSYKECKDVFLSTVAVSFLLTIAITGVLGTLLVLLWPDHDLSLLIALGVVFFWLHGWFELNLELLRSQLEPIRYGIVSAVKAALALGVGSLLVYAGFGPEGVLLGLIVASVLPMLGLFKKEWHGIKLKNYDRNTLRQLLNYGLPLTGTFALSFFTNSSDRFLLGWLLDTKAAGLYSVASDFAKQSILVMMMTVNLAAFPLAVRAYEHKSPEQARMQMLENGTLLLAISLPVSTAMVILSSNISSVLFGQAFAKISSELIPWIALGSFFSGVRMYYFDQCFHLGKATSRQVLVALGGAIVSVGMNIILIPHFGTIGSAYANVIAFATALLLSWVLGKKIFPLPLLGRGRLKLVIATAGMAVALWPVRLWSGSFALLCQVLLGLFVYCSLVLMLNICNSRCFVMGLLGFKLHRAP